MSLSSHLDDKQSPIRSLVHESSALVAAAGGTSREASAAKQALGIDDARTIGLVLDRNPAVAAGLAGTAFDFRVRMELGDLDPMRSSAMGGVIALRQMAERGYPPAQRHAAAAMQALHLITEMLSAPAVAPSTRTRCAIVLAQLETLYRAGPMGLAGAPGEAFGAANGDGGVLIEMVDDATIGEVDRLLAGSHRQIALWRSQIDSGVRYVENPRFAGSSAVHGADADWMLGDTLIEVKTTASALTPAIIRTALLQAIGYLLLDWDDEHEIRQLSLWFPRYDHSWNWKLAQLFGDGWEPEVAALRERMKATAQVPG